MFLVQNFFGKSSFLFFFPPRLITIITHKCYLYMLLNFLFFSVSDTIIDTGISDVFQNWIPVNERISNNCLEHSVA